MPENASAPLAFPDFPRLFARTRRFSLGVPAHLTVSPDGARVLFVRGTSGTDPVRRLWLYEDGEERVIADPLLLQGSEDDVPEAERTRRERARIRTTGVVSYATDDETSLVVFTLGGALWAVRTDGGAPWPVATAGPAVDPRPSPDGSWIAYVTDGALRAVRPDGTQDLLLAAPESAEVTYGLADHTAAESIGRSRGHWWSPAGDAVLAARVDTGLVRTWYVGDPADPQRPPRAVRYPVVGTANALTSLHVLRLDGSGTRVLLPAAADAEHPVAGAWTDPAFEYVTAAGWDAWGPLVSVQSRDQRSLHLLAVDPATGATTVLQRVHDGVWVDVVPGAPGRTAAGTPLAVVTDGDVPGLRIGAVATPAGLHVRDVLATAGDHVWFTANDEPTEVHVWSYDPEHGFARVSTEPGVHSAAVGGDTVVLDSLLESGPSVTVLRGGEQVGRIRVLAEEPEVTPAPQLLRLGERELRSLLFLPSGHRPGARRLPVLLCPYGGAGLQLAVRARDWWWSVAQWFAEQGFAVLITDGRGTPGRGRAWAREVHGDRLTLAVQDQVDAVHAAAERFPDLDLGAVGIRGWSYGGYLAAAAVLLRPDVVHAAVAGAAAADRRLYDTHWEERFLGHPGVVPEVYDRNSLMTYADRLVRPLLLVHGVADDNVHVAHALRLSSALLAAGREHSVLPLSGASHMVADEEQAGNLLRQELSFLKKSLKV